jgi:hypothetical protein
MRDRLYANASCNRQNNACPRGKKTVNDLLQWPAMLITVGASWYVASGKKERRKLGFYLFLASNVLWVAWGLPVHAYGLLVLQVFLAVMNIRGIFKAEPDRASP